MLKLSQNIKKQMVLERRKGATASKIILNIYMKLFFSVCEGDSRVTEECNTNDCPVWTEWTNWTECSLSCGGGTQQRIRGCVLPKSDELTCDGDMREIRTCNSDPCPVWTEWTEWTPCTTSCGGGKKLKTRECVLPKSLGVERLQLLCPGNREVVSQCNEAACPIPGNFSKFISILV